LEGTDNRIMVQGHLGQKNLSHRTNQAWCHVPLIPAEQAKKASIFLKNTKVKNSWRFRHLVLQFTFELIEIRIMDTWVKYGLKLMSWKVSKINHQIPE
jgi:hypothetical protein